MCSALLLLEKQRRWSILLVRFAVGKVQQTQQEERAKCNPANNSQGDKRKKDGRTERNELLCENEP